LIPKILETIKFNYISDLVIEERSSETTLVSRIKSFRSMFKRLTVVFSYADNFPNL